MTAPVPPAVAAQLSQALADREAWVDRIVEHYREGRDKFGEPFAMASLYGNVASLPPLKLLELTLAAISRLARTEVPGGDQS